MATINVWVIQTLSDRVAARQRELQGELERVGALVGTPKGKNDAQARSRKVKYRDGQNEWSGVGTMPAWLKAKPDIELFRVS